MQCQMQRVSAFKASPATKVRAVRPATRPCQLGRSAVVPKTFGPDIRQFPGKHARSVSCQGLFGLGLPEIAVIAGIAALVFGPSKLPDLGKGLGKTVKSFQSAASEFEKELKEAAKPDEAAAPSKPEEAPKKQE